MLNITSCMVVVQAAKPYKIISMLNLWSTMCFQVSTLYTSFQWVALSLWLYICRLLVIRWSGGMMRLIIAREVSYRGEAAGWVPVWHWEYKNLPYHTDAEPNNKFIIQVWKSLKYLKGMILCSKTYLKMHTITQNGVNALRLRTRTLPKRYRLCAAIDPRWHRTGSMNAYM